MALADDLQALITRKPGLSEADLAAELFGSDGYQQRVNSTCRRMIKQGRVRREGNGYQADPYRYFAT
jgi:hypothetical protein